MSRLWKCLVVLLAPLFLLSSCSTPGGPLVSYYYSNSNSYAGWNTDYYIYEENGTVVAKVVDYNYADMSFTFEKKDIDCKELKWVDSLLNDAGARKWKEDYQPIFEVLDGDNWSARFEFTDDTVNSGGYMAWPRKDPTREINERIKELVDYKVPEEMW